MKEIEFRVWDKVNKIMLQGENLKVCICNGNYDVYWKNKYVGDKNNFAVMQYIGVKDRFGTKIFDGDIDTSDEPMYVDCKDGMWGLRYYKDNTYFDHCIYWGGIKVSGNIYENPELLGN